MTGLFKVAATGPLAAHVEGFCAALVQLGYVPRTARDHGYVLAHLSRWLESEGLALSEFTPRWWSTGLSMYGVAMAIAGSCRLGRYDRCWTTCVRSGWCLMRGH
jgi:hypothetical protein